MVAAALVPLLLAGLSLPPKKAELVELRSPEIRLGDVADLRRLDAAARVRLENLIIARVPAGVAEMRLSREAIAGLVRRSVPTAKPFASAGEVLFTVARRPQVRPECKALTRPVRQGAPIEPAGLAPAPCDGTPGAVRFDRNGKSLRAAADLPAGSAVGRVFIPSPPAVEAGAKLTLLSSAGPVRIERPVTALQQGHDGGRVFVRDQEGQVISVLVALAEREGNDR